MEKDIEIMKKDLTNWAKSLREIDNELIKLQVRVHNMYNRMNEIYKELV